MEYAMSLTRHTTVPLLHTQFGPVRNVDIMVGKYESDGVAVLLFTEGEQYACLSVNLPQTPNLTDGWFYAKTWSENDGLVEALVGAGVIECDPMHVAHTGWVQAVACRLL